MSATFPITINCTAADPTKCESITNTSSTALCANGTTAGTSPCLCDTTNFPDTGSAN